MGFDLGRYVRLRDATMSVIEGVPETAAVEAAGAMVQAYRLIRAEVREQAGWEFVEEFDRLFPQWDALVAPGSGPGTVDDYHRARTLLIQLVGWLEGFIEQAQLETEARAYAEARLKKERDPAPGGPQA
jgi:hypothetical protein